jgi:hypothetical protein
MEVFTLKPAHETKDKLPPLQIGIMEKSIGPNLSPISEIRFT